MMIDTLSNTLSSITRKLAFIPGMYFVTKPLHKAFTRYYSKDADKAWRTISVNGYKMKLNMAHRMASLVYWRGAHEWAPMFLMQKEVKKGMTFYDVGANIGEFALFAANLVGAEGKVCAFEPMNDTFKTLQENVAINNYQKRVLPYNIALSDHQGEADLFAATEYTALGSMEDGFHTMYAQDDRSVFVHKTRLETMDDMQKELPAPDFLKVDVEGAELLVLKGALKTLEKSHPKILLEFNKDTFEAAGYTQQEVLDLLKRFGYKFYTIENRGKLLPLDESNLPAFVNLFCV
jgi:FkbM family methyltransferase